VLMRRCAKLTFAESGDLHGHMHRKSRELVGVASTNHTALALVLRLLLTLSTILPW